MPKKKTVIKKTATSNISDSLSTSPRQDKKESTQSGVRKNKLLTVGILLLVLIALTAYTLYKKYFVAAYVNGEPISRMEVINELEKQNGKNILKQLTSEKLILQEANKRHINVTSKEIDTQMKTIESSIKSQGMTLQQALDSQGMTKDQFTKQIKYQQLLQKMVKKPVVSDAEINDYIDKNNQQFTDVEKAKDDFKTKIRAQLLQQKQQEGIQKFLSDLESKAKIQTTVKY